MFHQEGSPAREYHEATKHRPGGMVQRRLIDVDLIPRQYKRYRNLPYLRLPEPAPVTAGPLTLASLSTLLRYSAGVVRRRRVGAGEIEFRAASCTGALYHIEIYLVCGPIDDMRAGVYHYDAPAETLVALRSGDYRRVLAGACGLDEPGPEAFLVMTSTFWRNAWRYQERAYRHAFWDSGTIAANLLALAQARGLSPRLHAGFIDDVVNYLLGIESQREAATCVIALGSGIEYAAHQEVEPVVADAEQLSSAEIEYPLIWRTHAATNLQHVPALRSWLDHVSHQEQTGGFSIDGLQSVIERRGSARSFTDDPISQPQLAGLLEAAVAPIPADFPELSRAFLVVNNVAGLPAGAYHFDTAAQRLPRLKRGDFRTEAAHLALDQHAAGAAAVNIYFMARLDDLLSRLGERGYRAAQLEGGIRGGRIYLKATELGLRATALTFYDDEVARFFGQPEDAAVLFLVVAGR